MKGVAFLFDQGFIQVAVLSREIKYINDSEVRVVIPMAYTDACIEILSKRVRGDFDECYDFKIDWVARKCVCLTIEVDYSSTLPLDLRYLGNKLKEMGLRVKIKI